MLELRLQQQGVKALRVEIQELPQGQMFVRYADKAIQDQTIYMLVGESNNSSNVHAIPVLTADKEAYGEVLDLPEFEGATKVYPIKAYVSHLAMEQVK